MNLRFICLGIYSMELLEIYRTKVRWMMGETKPTGHRRVWSALLTGGGLDVPAGNNHWLRKLAHGRELYLIPTGDIAAVVFTTELLTQLRSRGIDLDRVSNYRARQDGKVLGKTANMLPNRSLKSFRAGFLLGPRIRNRNMRSLQLRNHLAQLRQQLGWKSRNPKPTTIQPNGCQSRGLPHCPGSPAKKTCMGKPESIQYVFVEKNTCIRPRIDLR